MAQKTDVELLAQKQIIKTETNTNANSANRIGQMFEDVIDSKANNSALITREFNRTFALELLFDNNEIEYQAHELSGDLSFTLAGTGHLTNQFTSIITSIIFHGTESINFGPGIIPFGITNGGIPDAGTYYIMFLYWNGICLAHFMTPSVEEATGLQLLAPPNLAAVADGQNAIDLTWDDVDNEESYLIEWSLTGTGGWTTLEAPAAGVTSATQTGLSPGDIRFYRIKAIGDGINFLDSPYSTASATTEDAGDVTAPTFTWYPLNGTSAHRVNEAIVITADEGIRNDDGTEITNANVASVITLKETNSGGANIPFTATINGSKTIITVLPDGSMGQTQLVYVAIHDVEDVNGNEIAGPISITFTTTEYTLFNGTSNKSIFGNILGSLFTTTDTNFWVEITLNNPLLSGTKVLIAKSQSGTTNHTFYTVFINTDVYFVYYITGSAVYNRGIKWTGVLPSGESVVVFKYDGANDGGNGLDRVTLLIDGVIQGSKSLSTVDGALSGALQTSTAQLTAGIITNDAGVPTGTAFYAGEAKDFIIRSAAGSVVEINIPDLAAGTDISGNARHGTWTQ